MRATKYFKCNTCGRIKRGSQKQLKISCCGHYSDTKATKGQHIDFNLEEKRKNAHPIPPAPIKQEGAITPAPPAPSTPAPVLGAGKEMGGVTNPDLISGKADGNRAAMPDPPTKPEEPSSTVKVEKIDMTQENQEKEEDINPAPTTATYECGNCHGQTSNKQICDLCGIEFE